MPIHQGFEHSILKIDFTFSGTPLKSDAILITD